MTDFELAQLQYDRAEPLELVDDLDEPVDEYEDLYDLAARLIACTL